MCQLAPLAKETARTSRLAPGLDRAADCISGIASRMAKFSSAILPFTLIEPEQSSSQMKWTGRLAMLPPRHPRAGRHEGAGGRREVRAGLRGGRRPRAGAAAH